MIIIRLLFIYSFSEAVPVVEERTEESRRPTTLGSSCLSLSCAIPRHGPSLRTLFPTYLIVSLTEKQTQRSSIASAKTAVYLHDSSWKLNPVQPGQQPEKCYDQEENVDLEFNCPRWLGTCHAAKAEVNCHLWICFAATSESFALSLASSQSWTINKCIAMYWILIG